MIGAGSVGDSAQAAFEILVSSWTDGNKEFAGAALSNLSFNGIRTIMESVLLYHRIFITPARVIFRKSLNLREHRLRAFWFHRVHAQRSISEMALTKRTVQDAISMAVRMNSLLRSLFFFDT